VQFTTCKAVEDVILNYNKIVIKGKWVEVKKALPKEACQELQLNQDMYNQMLNEYREKSKNGPLNDENNPFGMN
jgi:RNA recognition motif-containing protein